MSTSTNPIAKVRALLPVAAAEAEAEPYCIDFVASTGAIDRTGEIIDQAGWKLETYRKTPVFQNAHRYGDVMHTLGRALVTEVREAQGRPALYQRIQFAVEANPVARVAYGLYRGRFLSVCKCLKAAARVHSQSQAEDRINRMSRIKTGGVWNSLTVFHACVARAVPASMRRPNICRRASPPLQRRPKAPG